MRTVSLALVALLAGFAGRPAGAQGTPPLTQEKVREVLETLVSVRSSDGLTLVVGDATLSGADALRLCQFATDVRARLSAYLGVPLEGRAFSQEIRVLPAPADGGGYVACTVLPAGAVRMRVWVAGLGVVPPDDVAGALCGGYLRADALANGWTGVGDVELGAAPYPVWLGDGVARQLDVASRQSDAEDVIALLEAGRLPPLASLVPMEGPLESRALASQMVAWALGSGPVDADDERPFAKLRAAVLRKGGWAPDAFLAGGKAGLPDAEMVWRTWLAHRKWVVLTPGMSHPAFVRRLRGAIRLFPQGVRDPVAEEGMPVPADTLARLPATAFEGPEGMDPEGLFRNRAEPWAAVAATAMSRRLQRAAAGHGPDVLAVAGAYGAFFRAVAERRPAEELRERLDEAEEMLSGLEGK